LDQLRQLGDLCMPRMRSSGPEDKRLAVDEERDSERERARGEKQRDVRERTEGRKEGLRGEERGKTHAIIHIERGREVWEREPWP
jgi:hypothetical protein